MAAITVSLGGQSVGGSNRDMFLKVFSGEVLAAYKKALVVTPLVRNRTIQSGKTAQFPITGRATATIHVPGANVLTENGNLIAQAGGTDPMLSEIGVNERTIHIDDKIIASTFIDELDEAMSHYDYRSPFASELGLELAYAREKLLLRILNKGAGVTQVLPHPVSGGTIEVGASLAYTTTQFIAGAYTAAEELDAAHVPTEGRYIIVTPEVWWLLSQSLALQNKDYGGAGKYPEGMVFKVAGLTIVKSTIMAELATEDVAGVFPSIGGLKNDYAGSDFENTLAIVMQQGAAGTLTLRGLSMQMEYKTEYQGDLLLARMAMGNGYLRPDAIKLIKVKVGA